MVKYTKYLKEANIPTTKVILGMSFNRLVYLDIEKNGTLAIIARQRDGKGVIIKNCITQMKNRPILIIDPHDEYDDVMFPNFHSRNPDRALFKIIDSFCMEINQFTITDFMSLGISESGARYIFNLIRNNPDITPAQILTQLENSNIHEGMKEAAIRKLTDLIDRGFFYNPDADDNRPIINNIGPMLQEDNIIIRLGMRNTGDMGKEMIRTYCGILLRNLKQPMNEKGQSYYQGLNPIIIVDEADMIAPTEEYSTATYMLKDIALKLQKDNVYLILITQNFDLLNPDLSNNMSSYILGRLNKTAMTTVLGNFMELTKGLRFHPQYNIREFVYIDKEYKFTKFNSAWDLPRCLA